MIQIRFFPEQSSFTMEDIRVAKEKIDLLISLFEVDLFDVDSLLTNETQEENNFTSLHRDFDFLQARAIIKDVETDLDILWVFTCYIFQSVLNLVVQKHFFILFIIYLSGQCLTETLKMQFWSFSRGDCEAEMDSDLLDGFR